jgi:hypothetical protein
MICRFSARSFVVALLVVSASVFGSDPGNYIAWTYALGWHATTFSGGTHELVDWVAEAGPCEGTFDITYPNGTKLIEVGYHLSNGYDPCFDIRSQYIGGDAFLEEEGVGASETDYVTEIGQFSDVLWIRAWGGSAELFGGTQAWVGGVPIHNGWYYSYMDYHFFWAGVFEPKLI